MQPEPTPEEAAAPPERREDEEETRGPGHGHPDEARERAGLVEDREAGG